MRIASSVLLAASALTWAWAPAYSAGLTASWGEVVVENLKPGEPYSLKEQANLVLSVRNDSDEPATIRWDTVLPAKEKLKPGCAALPDASWVVYRPQTAELKAREAASTDIVISVPPGDEHRGKRYQFSVWSRTVGALIGVGLKSRVILTVAKKPSPADLEKAFRLLPERMVMDPLPVGRVGELRCREGGPPRIVNGSGDEAVFRVESSSLATSSIRPPEGYEDCPAPGFLVVGKAGLTLPPNGSASIPLYLAFPEKAEFRGRKFAFVLRCSMTGPDGGHTVCSVVLVETEK